MSEWWHGTFPHKSELDILLKHWNIKISYCNQHELNIWIKCLPFSLCLTLFLAGLLELVLINWAPLDGCLEFRFLVISTNKQHYVKLTAQWNYLTEHRHVTLKHLNVLEHQFIIRTSEQITREGNLVPGTTPEDFC